MTNAVGYANNERMESGFDINRDFPYNQDPKLCMNTVAARVMYKIFKENLFVTAMTFHAGWKPTISFPWGSTNHRKPAEAPDFTAFYNLALVMQKVANEEDFTVRDG